MCRYEKYTKEKEKEKKIDKKTGDSFAGELEDLIGKVADVEALSDEVSQMRDRTMLPAKNAEIRRRKQALLAEDVEELKKLAGKGKVTKDEIKARLSLVCFNFLHFTSNEYSSITDQYTQPIKYAVFQCVVCERMV